MIEVQVFEGFAADVEKEVNAFLAEHGDVRLRSIKTVIAEGNEQCVTTLSFEVDELRKVALQALADHHLDLLADALGQPRHWD